jgi:hypothetical protein
MIFALLIKYISISMEVCIINLENKSYLKGGTLLNPLNGCLVGQNAKCVKEI